MVLSMQFSQRKLERKVSDKQLDIQWLCQFSLISFINVQARMNSDRSNSLSQNEKSSTDVSKNDNDISIYVQTNDERKTNIT